MEAKELHRALDQLWARFILAHPGKVLGNTTVWELMEWSARQFTDDELT